MADDQQQEDHQLEVALRMAIVRLARRMRLERAEDDLRDHQLSVLFVLLREGPITIGALSELERVSPPSMTRTVNVMVEAGYLTRTSADDDGRRVVIEVTDAGRRAGSEIRRRRQAWFSSVLEALSDDEQAALGVAAGLLQRLADS